VIEIVDLFQGVILAGPTEDFFTASGMRPLTIRVIGQSLLSILALIMGAMVMHWMLQEMAETGNSPSWKHWWIFSRTVIVISLIILILV
jgi:hypothetical protein